MSGTYTFTATEGESTTFTFEPFGGYTNPDVTINSASISGPNGTYVNNEDGTVTFTPDAGFTGEAAFSYSVQGLNSGGGGLPTLFAQSGDGCMDVQAAAPCFTTGMEIRTDRGPVAVEDLVPGDMVWTLDNGYQELKFIGHREVAAVGSLAPVVFKKGIIGNTKDIVVSPKHRFHVGSLPQELKSQFGENADTLLQAIAFCNGTTVRQATDMKTVEYFQLMFDDHQLVECHGTISESFQPTASALDLVGEQAEELLAIFPEIASRRAFHPGSLVRHEVRLKGQPKLQ